MTDLLATHKTDDEKGLRIRQRSRRLAGRAWLLAVSPRCLLFLETTDRVVVGCRRCVPTRARGEREGGAVSSGCVCCWSKCALGNGLAYHALGWGAGLHSTRLQGIPSWQLLAFWLFSTDCRGFVHPILAAERLNPSRKTEKRDGL